VKKNIKVCCSGMFEALAAGALRGTHLGELNLGLPVAELGGFRPASFAIYFCPWCGAELPFEHEEEKDG